MKIKLIKDKTNLHPELKVGTIGELKGSYGLDINRIVYFPSIKQTFQILDNQFETYLSPEEQIEEDKKLKSATNIIYNTGPSGGFKNIKYDFSYPINGNKTMYDRHEGLKIIEFFKKNNIPFITIAEERKRKTK